MKEITKQIQESYKNQEVISIYINKRKKELFSVGIVIAYTEEEVLIQSINIYGENDGYILRRIKDIYKIMLNDKYTKSIKQLYLYKKQTTEIITEPIKSLYMYILQKAQRERIVISIQDTQSKSMYCRVENIEDTNIEITKINLYGKIYAKKIYGIQEIRKINCYSKEEECIEILNRIFI